MSSQQSQTQPEITILARFKRSHDEAKPAHKEHRATALKHMPVAEEVPTDIFAAIGPASSYES